MLTLAQVSVGDMFESNQPVFRGDDIEWQADNSFEVVEVGTVFVKLKCDVEGQHTFAEDVPRPDNADDDYFFVVQVSIHILNDQFNQV